MYNYYSNGSIFWVKDPTAEDRRKRRPMVILWKNNEMYFLAKITSKAKKNRYCCSIDNWFEAGLDKPSYVRLDKLVNCTQSMLNKKNYIGTLEEMDWLATRSMLSSLY